MCTLDFTMYTRVWYLIACTEVLTCNKNSVPRVGHTFFLGTILVSAYWLISIINLVVEYQNFSHKKRFCDRIFARTTQLVNFQLVCCLHNPPYLMLNIDIRCWRLTDILFMTRGTWAFVSRFNCKNQRVLIKWCKSSIFTPQNIGNPEKYKMKFQQKSWLIVFGNEVLQIHLGNLPMWWVSHNSFSILIHKNEIFT